MNETYIIYGTADLRGCSITTAVQVQQYSSSISYCCTGRYISCDNGNDTPDPTATDG